MTTEKNIGVDNVCAWPNLAVLSPQPLTVTAGEGIADVGLAAATFARFSSH
jgi:hypothetical protein